MNNDIIRMYDGVLGQTNYLQHSFSSSYESIEFNNMDNKVLPHKELNILYFNAAIRLLFVLFPQYYSFILVIL